MSFVKWKLRCDVNFVQCKSDNVQLYQISCGIFVKDIWYFAEYLKQRILVGDTFTEKNSLIISIKMSIVKRILVKLSRIFGYHDRTPYFITRTFDRFNYKNLISILQLNL